jgi:hypothetical protein
MDQIDQSATTELLQGAAEGFRCDLCVRVAAFLDIDFVASPDSVVPWVWPRTVAPS